MMAATLDTLDLKLDIALQKLLKHEHILEGNGKPGLIKDVDRLTQLEESRKWHIRTIRAALIMAVIGLLVRGG